MVSPLEATALFLGLFSMFGYNEDLLARKDMSKPVLISGLVLMLISMRRMRPREV